MLPDWTPLICKLFMQMKSRHSYSCIADLSCLCLNLLPQPMSCKSRAVICPAFLPAIHKEFSTHVFPILISDLILCSVNSTFHHLQYEFSFCYGSFSFLESLSCSTQLLLHSAYCLQNSSCYLFFLIFSFLMAFALGIIEGTASWTVLNNIQLTVKLIFRIFSWLLQVKHFQECAPPPRS